MQINVGEIGVKKLFGKVQKEVVGSGLHFINPLLQMETIDVKTQNYTMSGVADEGKKVGDDAIRVLTADGLEVTIDLSVLYRLVSNDAPMLLQETGSDYEDKLFAQLQGREFATMQFITMQWLCIQQNSTNFSSAFSKVSKPILRSEGYSSKIY